MTLFLPFVVNTVDFSGVNILYLRKPSI